jgi:hypothetical protein
MERLQRISKRKLLIIVIIIGYLLGIGSFIGYRMATYKSTNVHYHANFALYINGQRDEFKSFTFYEEVQACVDHGVANPKSRTHMHNQDASLIHVHDGGVTWGHFFANLGYGLTDKAVQNDETVFTDADGKKLKFILNGKEVDTVANRVIASEDVLLINYGDEDTATLDQRFKTIPHNAHEFNGKYDPGGCSGNEQLTLAKRFKTAIGIEEQH